VISDVLICIGAVCVVAGLAWYSLPLGVIAGGVALASVGLLIGLRDET